MQTFVQDAQQPAVLLNHDNEYLHYQDDWYILASKPDSYVVRCLLVSLAIKQSHRYITNITRLCGSLP